MKRKIILTVALMAMVLFLTPALATAAGREPVKFYRDRFVFLGTYQGHPLVTSLTFDRGTAPEGRYRYEASFNGHLLFLNRWNHLKNKVYLQSRNVRPLGGIPPYPQCVVQWADGSRKGALNYDYQEISFLLQFKDLEVIDREARREDFVITTGLADATMQFMGETVPGRLIYRRMDLTGYNPFAHELDAMRHKKFNRFFLFDSQRFYVVWSEMERRGLRRLRFTPDRMIEYNPSLAPVDPTEDRPPGRVVSTDVKVKWTTTGKESNPKNPFREYPTGWKITARPPRNEQGELPEPVEIKLSSSSSFYWFDRGFFFVTGSVGGRPAWGLGEVIRGR